MKNSLPIFFFCQKRCVQCGKIFDHFSSTNSAWTNRLRQIFEILRSLLPSMTTKRYWLCIWGYQVFGWTLRSFPMWRYGDTYTAKSPFWRVVVETDKPISILAIEKTSRKSKMLRTVLACLQVAMSECLGPKREVKICETFVLLQWIGFLFFHGKKTEGKSMLSNNSERLASFGCNWCKICQD